MSEHWMESVDRVTDGDPRILGEDDNGDRSEVKHFLIDFYEWLFWQSGFSWREWRSLSKSARENPIPHAWNGEW